MSRPVTRVVTGTPSSASGTAIPERCSNNSTPARPSGRRVTAVPITPGVASSASVWACCTRAARRKSGAGSVATGPVRDWVGRASHAYQTARLAAIPTAMAARANVRTVTMTTPGLDRGGPEYGTRAEARQDLTGKAYGGGANYSVNGVTSVWVGPECSTGMGT